MGNNIKQSNFELMKIISMLMIILWHCIIFGNILPNCANTKVWLLFTFIEFIIVIHVNSFILCTGYFQYNKDIKVSKIMKLLNASWFWKTTILILLISFNIIHPNSFEIFRNVFILDTGQYWFINIYVLLYILSPFINKFIENLSKNNLKHLIFILFVIFCIIPTIFKSDNYAFVNDGYTLYHFVFLYLIGAYLHKYPIKKSLFKNLSNNSYKLVLFSVFFISCVFNFLLYYFCSNIDNIGNLMQNISSYYTFTSLNYNNPFIIVQSISYFLLFETINIKSNFINKLSSLAFGVYLIHMNIYLKDYLYKWLLIDNGSINNIRFIIYVIAIVLLIYIVCSILEYLRIIIFKFVYNRKICKKWRRYYRTWISDCGIKFNWQ